MIEQANFSFDEPVSLDARWMKLEIPPNVSLIANTAADELLIEFEDHRLHDERNTSRTNWSFLTFWVSCAAGIVSIAVWALT